MVSFQNQSWRFLYSKLLRSKEFLVISLILYAGRSSSLVLVCRGQCFQWHLKMFGSSKTCICMCTSVCVLPAFICNMWLCIAYCIFGQQALLMSARYERHVTDVVLGTWYTCLLNSTFFMTRRSLVNSRNYKPHVSRSVLFSTTTTTTTTAATTTTATTTTTLLLLPLLLLVMNYYWLLLSLLLLIIM